VRAGVPQQLRLADAGLTLDQNGTAPPAGRCVDDVAEPRQLGRSLDQQIHASQSPPGHGNRQPPGPGTGIGTGLPIVAVAAEGEDACAIDRKEPPMIARIVEHSHLPADLDPDYVARHRTWMAAQPGFCGGYHLLDGQTGQALSVTIWQDDDALAAAERAQGTADSPADGRLSRHTNPTIRIVQVAAVF
jgi:hypothetical protein